MFSWFFTCFRFNFLWTLFGRCTINWSYKLLFLFFCFFSLIKYFWHIFGSFNFSNSFSLWFYYKISIYLFGLRSLYISLILILNFIIFFSLRNEWFNFITKIRSIYIALLVIVYIRRYLLADYSDYSLM